MDRRCSLFLSEAYDKLLNGINLLPYLLIPVMLSLLVKLESLVSPGAGFEWLTGPVDNPLHSRVALALWNASISIAMIAVVKSALYFSSVFGSGWFRATIVIPRKKCSPYWDSFIAQAVLVGLIFILTNTAVIAAMPRTEGFPWLSTLLACLLPVAWSISFGALAGVLARPAPAVFLSVCVLAGSLVPAFKPLEPGSGWWFIVRDFIFPPISALVTGSVTGRPAVGDMFAVGAHAVFAALVARWFFGEALKRRRDS